jgi:hypothetical protein
MSKLVSEGDDERSPEDFSDIHPATLRRVAAIEVAGEQRSAAAADTHHHSTMRKFDDNCNHFLTMLIEARSNGITVPFCSTQCTSSLYSLPNPSACVPTFSGFISLSLVPFCLPPSPQQVSLVSQSRRSPALALAELLDANPAYTKLAPLGTGGD